PALHAVAQATKVETPGLSTLDSDGTDSRIALLPDHSRAAWGRLDRPSLGEIRPWEGRLIPRGKKTKPFELDRLQVDRVEALDARSPGGLARRRQGDRAGRQRDKHPVSALSTRQFRSPPARGSTRRGDRAGAPRAEARAGRTRDGPRGIGRATRSPPA